jgi:voltage-gated potassium channel
MRNIFRLRSYISLFVAQLLVIVIAMVGEDAPILYLPFMYLFLGSVISSVWDTAWLRILAFVLSSFAVVLTITPHVVNVPDGLGGLFGIAGTLFMAACAVIGMFGIGRNVFGANEASADKIIASICIYLLIGMLFALLYDSLGNIFPSSFNLSERTAHQTESFSDYVYFSFVTLTTTGYGDMIPVAPFARAMAVLEAIMGPLYLAITVARLVGMQISKQIKDDRGEI